MKKYIIICLLCAFFYLYADESPKFTLSEIGIGSGYGSGTLTKNQGNYHVVPLFLHLGFSFNKLVGLTDDFGDFQMALEPFYNRILSPKSGYEVGFDLFFKYAQKLFGGFAIYGEVGAGPMYLSIETKEQAAPGFNFLDQVGAGIQIYGANNHSMSLGYRYRHISHAGIRGKPNRGIDTHAMIFGFFYHL